MKFEINKETKFRNAKHNEITLDSLTDKIISFINEANDYEYRLSIGTDSMTHQETKFCLAIVVHRVGNGGIYFYKKFAHPRVEDLRTKLYTETQLSVDAMELILNNLIDKDENILDKLNLSIHLDIGKNGPTKELIKELEGWIKAIGYESEIKPDSYAASSVADMYSK